MGRQHYSNEHYRRLSNGGPDSEEQVAERIRYREAGEQAWKETIERFKGLDWGSDPKGVVQAMAWRDKRLKEILEEGR